MAQCGSGAGRPMTADRAYELLVNWKRLAFLCRWAWEHGRRLKPSPGVIQKWRADLDEYLDYLGQSPEFTVLASSAPEASRLLFLDRLRTFRFWWILFAGRKETGRRRKAVRRVSGAVGVA